MKGNVKQAFSQRTATPHARTDVARGGDGGDGGGGEPGISEGGLAGNRDARTRESSGNCCGAGWATFGGALSVSISQQRKET